MPQTVIEKITQAHAVGWPAGREVRAGDYVTIRPDHVMTHDNTSAVLKKFQGLGASRVHDPLQPVYALDHEIQNTTPENLAKYATIEGFAKEQGIVFHPGRRGHRPPAHGGERLRPSGRLHGGQRLAQQHVRGRRLPGHAHRAHRCGSRLGDGHLLVAGAAHGQGGPRG